MPRRIIPARMSQPSHETVLPGTRVGVYEITGPLGAGGMGQVYRARDTRLDRDVALKLLPEAFASDADRVMRFTREAKTLAALNHPHIAQVYDAGREGARAFIAMELVSGDDLSARIRHGAIPLTESLQIARQIADALAAAHDAGIVHRDLKPANIKLTDDDVVKVLDFGLAKGTVSDTSTASESGATMTSPAMTAMGVILGTAAYMSPEQAKGKAVDRRTDVWAFGVVLYEMLTGAFLFGKEDITDTLAAVLTLDPDLSKLPVATPPAIKRLLAHCLAKDRRHRLDSMAAARIEIDDVLAGKVEATALAPAMPRASSTWLFQLALVAGGLIAGALVATLWPRALPVSQSSSGAIVARITAPRDVISAFHDGFAISTDGLTLAFAARNPAGTRQIWVRKLDADTARAIPGTERGTHPFWSPDGRSIGFFSDGKLRRVDIDGSRLQTICDAPGSQDTGTWNIRDEILFSTNLGSLSRVIRVPASGGVPSAFEALGRAIGPAWLDDGQRFLFASWTGNALELRLAAPDGQSSKSIAPLTRGTPEFSYAGGFVFLNKNDTLVAQRLDPGAGALVGAAVPIAPIAGNPKDWFSVSSDGDRVVALVRESPGDTGDPGDPGARLVWVDRQGNTIDSLGDSGRYWTMRLGPDQKSAIVNPGNDIWLLRPDGRHTRLTSGPQSVSPVWSPDGSEIIYLKVGGGVVRRRLDPQSPPATLEDARGYPQDWSSDGRWLLTSGRSTPTSTSSDINVYDLEKKTGRPFVATDFVELNPKFSPDARWIAYTSNSSGRQEVYVRPFEGTGDAIPISTTGGAHPFWRRDGNEIYFLAPTDDVMAVPIARSGASLTPGQPQRLFRVPLNDITRSSWPPYAPAADGQRFLLNVPDRPTPLFFLQGLRGMVK